MQTLYQVQMHPNMNKEAHFDAKKDLRNHPMLSRRANPNIGIANSIKLKHACSFSFIYTSNALFCSVIQTLLCLCSSCFWVFHS